MVFFQTVEELKVLNYICQEINDIRFFFIFIRWQKALLIRDSHYEITLFHSVSFSGIYTCVYSVRGFRM